MRKYSSTKEYLVSSHAVVISIPTILLWRVKIALRKKLAIGSVLCLSIFLIIISIIKVVAVHTIGTQVDTTWGIFWVQAEAAVAVIAVSITIFRSFFAADGSKNRPQQNPRLPRSATFYRKLGTQRTTSQIDLPAIPTTAFSCGTTITPDAEAHASKDMDLPIQETDILVTRDFSMQVVSKLKNVALRSFRVWNGWHVSRHNQKGAISHRTIHSGDTIATSRELSGNECMRVVFIWAVCLSQSYHRGMVLWFWFWGWFINNVGSLSLQGTSNSLYCIQIHTISCRDSGSIQGITYWHPTTTYQLDGHWVSFAATLPANTKGEAGKGEQWHSHPD